VESFAGFQNIFLMVASRNGQPNFMIQVNSIDSEKMRAVLLEFIFNWQISKGHWHTAPKIPTVKKEC